MNIAIIGGGPGGYVAAIRAAQLGANVQLIECDSLGGTCLNRGCIPTKALLHAAETLEDARDGAKLGVIAEPKLDFSKTVQYKNETVKKLVLGVTGLMRANKIEVINGEASFTGAKALSVKKAGGESLALTPDRIIIAAGSEPARPPIPGIDTPCCIDSTGALSLEAVPARIAIIGGGVIGVEMATAFSAFGSEVTIIEMMPEILPMMDSELVALLRVKLKNAGITVITGAKVLSVAGDEKSGRVAYDLAGAESFVEAEKILVSTGRKIATDSLNLAAAGIANERGRILVNARQETNVSGIYAIGDCTGGSMLAHVASAQGEVSAENAAGHSAEYNALTNPSCVYTRPELAGAGLTEDAAKAKGLDIKVGHFPLMANGKTQIVGSDGLVKIIAGRKYGEILGVHIMGPRATDLISATALMIGLEATSDELINTIFAHPTIAESIREAALNLEGRPIHIPPAF